MAQHTPGPWKLELVQKWPFGVRVTAGDYEIMAQSADSCASGQKTRSDNERGVGFDGKRGVMTAAEAVATIARQDADARLIAAAPDLLAALTDMLAGWHYIRRVHGDLYGVGWDRCDAAATAAIAKATE